MPGSAKKRHGKGGRLSVGGSVLSSRDLDVQMKGEAADVTAHDDWVQATNTTNKTSKMGVVYCTITGTLVWDAGANPYDSPPGLYPRDDLATVKIWINVADNTFFLFPLVTVNSVRVKVSVKDAVTFDCDMESNGPFTQPTGSV